MMFRIGIVVIAIVLGIAGFIGLVLLGYVIFHMVALPDTCDYHNKDVDTSWLFDLFFPITAVNGFHPGPGLVFYLTALAGGIVAGVLSFRWMKRWTASRSTK